MESKHLNREIKYNNSTTPFILALDKPIFDEDKLKNVYKKLDYFEKGYQFLKADQMLGGPILRPLNSSDAKFIDTPFL